MYVALGSTIQPCKELLLQLYSLMAQVDLITSVHKGGRLFGTMSVILTIVAFNQQS